MHSRSYPEAVISLFLLTGLLAGAPARAESDPRASTPPRVGVVVSTAVNLSPEAQVDLSQRVGDALAEELIVDVTAGREVSRRLEASPPEADCYLKPDCQAEVASRLEVEQLLTLVVVRLGTRLQIEPTWIDVPTGRAVVRDAIVTDSVKEDLSTALRAAASRLLPEAARRPSLAPRATAEVAPTLAPTVSATVARSRPPVATWISFGVGVAAVAVGLGLGLSASADYRQLAADGCRNNPCEPGRVDAVDRKALAADLSFGAAGVAVVTGTILWWLDARSEGLAVSPVITEESAGLALGGRF